MSNLETRRYGVASPISTLQLASMLMFWLVAIFSSGAAIATPQKDFTSVVVGPTDYEEIDIKTHAGDQIRGHSGDLKIMFEMKGAADVYNVTNTVKPQGHSGWHQHPGPTLITVAKGTATYYEADDPTCTPHVVHQGEGFIDLDYSPHLVRNASTVAGDDLVLIAFQIIPEGMPRRIDFDAPPQCPLF